MLLIDLAPHFLVENPHLLRKYGLLGMTAVELLERIAHRLHAAIHVLRNAAGNLAGAAAGLGHPPRAIDNFSPLIFREQAKSLAALDPLAVLRHETIDAAPQKPDALAT